MVALTKMQPLRSAIPWIGGKFYSRKRIVEAFPDPSSYRTYVEPFCGALHILLAKPPYKHLEVINDASGDLINFWMCCRNHPQELQALIDTLPYSRQLYEDWRASLFESNTEMSDMERAVRWFYVLRSAVGGRVRQTKGNWGYVKVPSARQTTKLFAATELFSVIAERCRHVQFEHGDFGKVIATYGHTDAFLYCDPPYIGAEFYYEDAPFMMADHERLAHLLNETSAKVALSYYPHPLLDEWYPAHKWRRMTWQTYKHAEKTSASRQKAQEILLMNYAPSHLFWEVQ